ncbi:unnamed protein product [Brachionus calyciflorus]|uniref:Protein quiver n=1 Tax=Brachionus calyciflorus TaxID=104777 RepID=A0A814CGB4_9BILA|nr:unnamed protein product [Brachionus calyciflorus]
MELRHLGLSLILIFSLITKIFSQTPLKCYVCNSNYRKCGDSSNFDSTIQSPSYCYGNCLKISVSPGDFIIRSCSTFIENSYLLQNLTTEKTLNTNQCYIGKYLDPINQSSREAYICLCNDKAGCNRSNSNYNFFSIYSLTFIITKLFYK